MRARNVGWGEGGLTSFITFIDGVGSVESAVAAPSMAPKPARAQAHRHQHAHAHASKKARQIRAGRGRGRASVPAVEL